MEKASAIAFEVEHITPKRDGGTNDDANLALSCRSCNQYKGAATTGTDSDTGAEAALFHPRTDDWDEHFRYDIETFCVVGRTPTGRATVERFQMNNPFQLAARRVWRAAGLPF